MSKLYRMLALFDETKYNIPKNDANNGQIQSVIQLALAVSGAIAVLIITMAGFQYIISQGDPGKIAKAKDTILYAVIGLVLVIMAEVVVRLVISKVG